MIINLNQYRKKRRRTDAETRAKENRVRFGRSKEERTAELRERERAKRRLKQAPRLALAAGNAGWLADVIVAASPHDDPLGRSCWRLGHGT